MSDDPDRSLACSTRGGNPTLESDEELQRQQKGGKRAYTIRLVKDRSPRHSRKSLRRPFRRARHARRWATLAEIRRSILATRPVRSPPRLQSALHCGIGELSRPQQELDLSFQHLHHLEDETAGRPDEGKTSSTKSRRYFGWLNKDLGAERANACVLGVEVVHFVDRMGEAGPHATGNKILEHDGLEEEHADAGRA